MSSINLDVLHYSILTTKYTVYNIVNISNQPYKRNIKTEIKYLQKYTLI